MREPTKKVVVVGQGYVGLPLAMRAVEVGYEVVGFDKDPRRVELLATATSYVEDVSSEQLVQALATGRYFPTIFPARHRGVRGCPDNGANPPKGGGPDLSFVTEATNELAAHLQPGALVVLESTTYPGTTEELLAGLLADGSGLVPGRDFHLGYSPERIDPGNRHFSLVEIPKVVSGINASSLARCKGSTTPWCARPSPYRALGRRSWRS